MTEKQRKALRAYVQREVALMEKTVRDGKFRNEEDREICECLLEKLRSAFHRLYSKHDKVAYEAYDEIVRTSELMESALGAPADPNNN